MSHREDRTRRAAHDLFGDAAEQHMRDPAAAVRTHHDQIDIVLGRITQDLGKRPGDRRADRHTGGIRRRYRLRETLLRFLLPFVDHLEQRRRKAFRRPGLRERILHDVQEVQVRVEAPGKLEAVA
jgi:hypothetical protein